MASLFIKDPITAERVERMARQLGTSKTETVRQAMDALEQRVGKAVREKENSLLERLDAWRAAHPLPPPTGLKADKAFFDELWGEEPDD